MKDRKQIMNKNEMARALERIAYEIIEKAEGRDRFDELVIVGIRTRGAYLADRLQKMIHKITQVELPVGILDITLYRDDLTLRSEQPIVGSTEIPVDVTGKSLILVDDVIYTGRTTRAALDALMDLGRPKSIKLAVLIDRGRRELPIHPDFTGRNVPTSKNEKIDVQLMESDNREKVDLVQLKGKE